MIYQPFSFIFRTCTVNPAFDLYLSHKHNNAYKNVLPAREIFILDIEQ